MTSSRVQSCGTSATAEACQTELRNGSDPLPPAALNKGRLVYSPSREPISRFVVTMGRTSGADRAARRAAVLSVARLTGPGQCPAPRRSRGWRLSARRSWQPPHTVLAPCWHKPFPPDCAGLRARPALTCTDCSGLLRPTSAFGAGTGLLMRWTVGRVSDDSIPIRLVTELDYPPLGGSERE